MYTGTDFISTKFARARRQWLSKKRYCVIKRNHMFSAVGSITSTLSTPYNGKRQVGVVASYTLYIFAPPLPEDLSFFPHCFPSCMFILLPLSPLFWYTLITICQCFCFNHILKKQVSNMFVCVTNTMSEYLSIQCFYVSFKYPNI